MANTKFSFFYKIMVASALLGTVLSSMAQNNVTGDVEIVAGDRNQGNVTLHSSILGSDNTVTDTDIVLAGDGNTVTNGHGVISGDVNQVTSSSSSSQFNVIGNFNSIDGDNNNIFGANSEITGNNSSVLGNNATVTANDAVAIGQGAVANRDNTVSVGSSGAERQITNVAAGTELTDAVNLGQMQAADAEILNSSKSYTDNSVNTISQSMTAYTDMQVSSYYDLSTSYTDYLVETEAQARIEGDLRTLQNANFYTDQKLSDYSRKANAGISGAMAIASIPYVNDKDFSLGIGVGTYRNGSSFAAGMQIAPTKNTLLRVNLSYDNTKTVGAGAGFSIGW